MKKCEKLSKLSEFNESSEFGNIEISDEIKSRKIRGVYGIFSKDADNKKTCIYIGRAYDILERFISYNGHLSPFIYRNDDENFDSLKQDGKMAIVPKLILEELENNKTISIEVLKEVNFDKNLGYYRDMQKLASVECQLIDEYQTRGECLHQLPEGRWMSEEAYNKMFE